MLLLPHADTSCPIPPSSHPPPIHNQPLVSGFCFLCCFFFFTNEDVRMCIFLDPFLIGWVTYYRWSVGLRILHDENHNNQFIEGLRSFLQLYHSTIVWMNHSFFSHVLFPMPCHYRAAMNITFCISIFILLEVYLPGSDVVQRISVYFIRCCQISL